MTFVLSQNLIGYTQYWVKNFVGGNKKTTTQLTVDYNFDKISMLKVK